jgi:hypothetical protein
VFSASGVSDLKSGYSKLTNIRKKKKALKIANAEEEAAAEKAANAKNNDEYEKAISEQITAHEKLQKAEEDLREAEANRLKDSEAGWNAVANGINKAG